MTKYYAVNVDTNGEADSTNNYQGYANENDVMQELHEMGYEQQENGEWIPTDRTASEGLQRVRIVEGE